jgi:S-layer protein
LNALDTLKSVHLLDLTLFFGDLKMSYTTGNDINILSSTDTNIVDAGAGNDRYILSSDSLSAGQSITISDAQGANTLQLIDLTIASTKVMSNAVQLTLSNGAVVNINGADTFTYLIGGSATKAISATNGTTQTFAQFVTTTLGIAAVPAAGAALVSGGAVNNITASGLSATAGTTFTLTTGIDNITGTTGDDSIVAINNATTTWGALDVVDGGAGNDTFTYTDTAVFTGAPPLAKVLNVETINIFDTASTGTVTLNTASDTANFTNLKSLSLTTTGATTEQVLTAATTTDVTAKGFAPVTVDGGKAVTVTGKGAITIGGTTTPIGDVTVTNSAQGVNAISIKGGAAVTLTATATDGGAGVALGNVTVGGTTTNAPTGAVNVTVTDTYSASGTTLADITVTGGVGATVNSTVNANLAIAVHSETTGANEAGIITVAPTSGAVVVNSATNVTKTTSGAVTVNASAISVTSGSSVTVNQTATTVQTAASVSTIAQGAVGVTGDLTTTTVIVNQAAAATGQLAAVAVAGVAGVPAVSAVTAAAGTAGVTAVTGVAAVTAVAAKTATPTVTLGAVTIADKNAGSSTIANTITAVTLSNYGNSSITSTALNTVTLAGTGTSGTLSIIEGGSAATVAANKTLTLNVSGGTKGVITDVSNQFSTVKAVLGTDVTLGGITDTALRTLNVSGTGVLTLSAVNTALTSVTTEGATGLKADLSALTGLTSIAMGGTAANTVTINSTTQTYAGGTGNDTVTITADATKTITGGAGTNELILSATGSISLTAANSGAKISGFQTLGVAAGVTGPIDMSTLPSDINALHVIGNSSDISFTKVAANTPLSIDVARTATSYKLASTGGSSKSVSVNLGTSTSDTVNFGTVELVDANGNGIGTVNLVSNGVNITAGDAIPNTNTARLTNAGLTNLNVSGTQGLTLTEQTIGSAITGLSINNTNTGSAGLVISTLIASGADNLSFAGTGKTTITTLFDGSIGNVSLTNTGSQDVTVGNLYSGTTGTTAAVFTDLTLSGNIALTATTSSTSATTVNGATNNAAVNLTFSGSNSAVTTVTLGNGNNTINLSATSGANVVKTGSGLDLITGGTGADSIDGGAGDDVITGRIGNDTIIGGTGSDYIRGDKTGDTYTNATTDVDTIFLGSKTTGATVTSGTFTGTLYTEGSDTIATTGINADFASIFAGSLITGYKAILNNANIVEGRYGNDVIVASSAKDVFMYQTGNGATTTANGTGLNLGTDVIQNFKIGTDLILAINSGVQADPQVVGDTVYVGANASTYNTSLVAANIPSGTSTVVDAASNWAWTLDSGKTDSGTLAYTAPSTFSTGYANGSFSIHLVGVQGTGTGTNGAIAVGDFFYGGAFVA